MSTGKPVRRTKSSTSGSASARAPGSSRRAGSSRSGAEATRAAATAGADVSAQGLGPTFEDLFTYKLSVLVKHADRLTAERYRDAAGLTLSEARAVTILAGKQPLQVQQLARYGSLDKSQASRVAVSLQRRGLVERSDSTDDRRAWDLRLTPAGERVHASLIALARARNAQLLAPLTAAQRRTLIGLVDRLVAGCVDDGDA